MAFGCGWDGSSLSGLSCANLSAAAFLHCCSREVEEDRDDELLERDPLERFMPHGPMKPLKETKGSAGLRAMSRSGRPDGFVCIQHVTSPAYP